MRSATTRFFDGRWLVIYEGQEIGRFKPQDDTDAVAFCNGFNCGLDHGAAPYRVREHVLCPDCAWDICDQNGTCSKGTAA